MIVYQTYSFRFEPDAKKRGINYEINLFLKNANQYIDGKPEFIQSESMVMYGEPISYVTLTVIVRVGEEHVPHVDTLYKKALMEEVV